MSPRRRAGLHGMTSDDARLLRGACACGTLAYRVADAFTWAANCHCSRCRAATGAAFKPFARIPRERLELVRGDADVLVVGGPGDHDTRCGRCGSLLFSTVGDGGFAHVALGTLRDAPSMRPSCHIFVGSKAPWFEITDDLPQFARLPG
jgi:hypothetical protein